MTTKQINAVDGYECPSWCTSHEVSSTSPIAEGWHERRIPAGDTDQVVIVTQGLGSTDGTAQTLTLEPMRVDAPALHEAALNELGDLLDALTMAENILIGATTCMSCGSGLGCSLHGVAARAWEVAEQETRPIGTERRRSA